MATPTRRGRGVFLVVAGPDGSGKSTVADALTRGPLGDRRVLRLHHRPQVLGPAGPRTGPVTEPHGEPPRAAWLSLLKVLYLYADYLVGWLVRIRPALRAGGHVVLERGWWDLVVDPARYRLQGVRGVTRILGRLLPRPDFTIVLAASPRTLMGRKVELPRAELARQLAAWETVPARLVRPLRIETSSSLEETVEDVVQLAAQGPGRAWAGLPRRRAPRWLLPTAPRRAARNSVLVYTPVTPRGRAAWLAARSMSGLGALRLLPRAENPDRVITERLAPHAPLGFIVAVARSYWENRVAALVLDAGGLPWGLAKLAFDERGRAALEHEAEAVTMLGPLLPRPLAAPRLLVRTDGLLVFEAVQWAPQRRPWFLADTTAHALGRFFRAGRTAGDEGPAHGDCAPWNMLHAEGTVYLVDWADARRAAPPFYDVFHHVVQSHVLLGAPDLQEIMAGLDGEGWVGAALQAYALAAQLDLSGTREAFVWYLQRSVDNLDPGREDGQRGIRARSALLDVARS